jgi:hypothetical protein
MKHGFFSDLNEASDTPIDHVTANLMITVWDKMSDDQRERLLEATHVDTTRYVEFCWKVTK